MTSNLLPFSVPSGNLVARSLGYLLVLVVVLFCGWATAQDADNRTAGDFSAVSVPTAVSVPDDCPPGPLIPHLLTVLKQQRWSYTLLLIGPAPAGSPNIPRPHS